MSAYDFVQLAFLALGGEIKGKTKLQKIVYFLGLATGHEDELGYRPHFYGPYSDEVASAVERLKVLGFLDQTVAGVGTVDSRGFEVARHDYCLNESGKSVAEAKSRLLAEDWSSMKEAAKAGKQLLGRDYMQLSIAAKTFFMLREKQGRASMKDLESLAPRFGWSVSAEQIRDAAKVLQDAGFVQLANG
jgi:uncharacterized protein